MHPVWLPAKKIYHVAGPMEGAKQAERMQTALLELLARQVDRYTMGDSSSVPAELAEQLTQSIQFTLELAEPMEQKRQLLLMQGEGEALLQKGRSRIQRLMQKGKQLLRLLYTQSLHFGNLAYRDTVYQALPDFFVQYDLHFFAHDIPCMLDYPLCVPVEDTQQGICYILEFLRRLCMENHVLKHYMKEQVLELLQNYVPDYRVQVVNLLEPVFRNAVTILLLGRHEPELSLSQADCILLKDRLQRLGEHSIPEAVERCVQSLSHRVRPGDKQQCDYLQQMGRELTCRLQKQLAVGELDGLFVLSRDKPMPESQAQYHDAEPMPDTALRELMDDLTDCRFTSDKMEMVRAQVHSMRDLMELLPLCFSDDEWMPLFDGLGEVELALLWAGTGREAPWHKVLQQCIEHLPAQRRQAVSQWRQRFTSAAYLDYD